MIHAILLLILNALPHLPYEVLVEALQTELGEMVEMFMATMHEDKSPEETMGYMHSALGMYSILLTVASRGGIQKDEEIDVIASSSIGLHGLILGQGEKLGDLDLGISMVRAGMRTMVTGKNAERAEHTVLSAYDVPQVRELFEKLTKAG